jgi:hypothetical protein
LRERCRELRDAGPTRMNTPTAGATELTAH